MRAALEGDRLPVACATSVCVPIARKLKIQKMLDRAIVPTPSAARDSEPSRAIKAVSTKPVTGSAIKDSSTGNDRKISVR